MNASMAVLWWKKWSQVYASSKSIFWVLFDSYLDALYTDRS